MPGKPVDQPIFGAVVKTWGTDNTQPTGIFKHLDVKLYGGNVGHSALELCFPVNDTTEELVEDYLEPRYGEEQASYTYDRKNVIMPDGSSQEVYYVYFSWYGKHGHKSKIEDMIYQRLGVAAEQENSYTPMEQRNYKGFIGNRFVNIKPVHAEALYQGNLSDDNFEKLKAKLEYYRHNDRLDSLNKVQESYEKKMSPLKTAKDVLVSEDILSKLNEIYNQADGDNVNVTEPKLDVSVQELSLEELDSIFDDLCQLNENLKKQDDVNRELLIESHILARDLSKIINSAKAKKTLPVGKKDRLVLQNVLGLDIDSSTTSFDYHTLEKIADQIENEITDTFAKMAEYSEKSKGLPVDDYELEQLVSSIGLKPNNVRLPVNNGDPASPGLDLESMLKQIRSIVYDKVPKDYEVCLLNTDDDSQLIEEGKIYLALSNNEGQAVIRYKLANFSGDIAEGVIKAQDLSLTELPKNNSLASFNKIKIKSKILSMTANKGQTEFEPPADFELYDKNCTKTVADIIAAGCGENNFVLQKIATQTEFGVYSTPQLLHNAARELQQIFSGEKKVGALHRAYYKHNYIERLISKLVSSVKISEDNGPEINKAQLVKYGAIVLLLSPFIISIKAIEKGLNPLQFINELIGVLKYVNSIENVDKKMIAIKAVANILIAPVMAIYAVPAVVQYALFNLIPSIIKSLGSVVKKQESRVPVVKESDYKPLLTDYLAARRARVEHTEKVITQQQINDALGKFINELSGTASVVTLDRSIEKAILKLISKGKLDISDDVISNYCNKLQDEDVNLLRSKEEVNLKTIYESLKGISAKREKSHKLDYMRFYGFSESLIGDELSPKSPKSPTYPKAKI